MKTRNIMVWVATGFTAFACSAKTLYVAPDGDDAKDGSSWANALKSPEVAGEKLRDSDGNTLNWSSIIISNGVYKLTAPIELSVRKSPAKQDVAHITIKSFTGNPEDVVLDGQGACQAIRVTGYSNEILGLTVTNCTVEGSDGGGIYCNARTSQIRNCIVRDCHVKGKGNRAYGGGIYAQYASVVDTMVENCSCVQDASDAARSIRGGGIYAYETLLTNCVVRFCKSEGTRSDNSDVEGGGIYWSDDKGSSYEGRAVLDCVVEHCRCTSSHALGGVGVLSVSWGAGGNHGLAAVRDCKVSFCEVTGSPVSLNYVHMQDCAIICNTNVSANATSENRTVGVRAANSSRIEGCIVSGNYGTGAANYNEGKATGTPAIRPYGAGVYVANCLVSNNVGGAHVCLELVGASSTIVSNCVFDGNIQHDAKYGGLVHCDDFGGNTADVIDCSFVNNDASVCPWGGFLFFRVSGQDASRLTFRNCRITDNQFGSNAMSMFTQGAAQEFTKQHLEIENCTIVSNRLTGTMVHGYYEKAWSHCASSNIFVKGSAVLWNAGATYQISPLLRANTDHMTFSLSTESVTYPGELGNLVYDPEKPLFRDIANGDIRPADGSQLCDRVPYSPWMGEDKRRSPTRDLGSGYEAVASGKYGVSIVRKDSNPRFSGSFADIGCCETFVPPGLMLHLR